jgi:hypothetical protein
MIVGLVAAVCAFGALSAPAFAKIEEPKEHGKFKATVTGKAKGHGEAGEMKIGPYTFPTGCTKELKSKGEVAAGESETFYQTVQFKNCISKRNLGGGIEEPVPVGFTLGMEFKSNGTAEFGEPGTVTIKQASVKFKGRKSFCEVTIPTQTIPRKAEKKPEEEFEAFSYSTEKEKLTAKGAIKKYGEFRERLDIEWEFRKLLASVKITPDCTYNKGEEGKFNEETGEVDFGTGRMEGELEEITLKGGNLSFIPV